MEGKLFSVYLPSIINGKTVLHAKVQCIYLLKWYAVSQYISILTTSIAQSFFLATCFVGGENIAFYGVLCIRHSDRVIMCFTINISRNLMITYETERSLNHIHTISQADHLKHIQMQKIKENSSGSHQRFMLCSAYFHQQ